MNFNPAYNWYRSASRASYSPRLFVGIFFFFFSFFFCRKEGFAIATILFCYLLLDQARKVKQFSPLLRFCFVSDRSSISIPFAPILEHFTSKSRVNFKSFFIIGFDPKLFARDGKCVLILRKGKRDTQRFSFRLQICIYLFASYLFNRYCLCVLQLGGKFSRSLNRD